MKQLSLKNRGFTLIELLVVVAIIAILSTLLIVGISKLQTNSKRQQTVQILENCRAMWAEYDSVARLHVDQATLPCPGNVTLEAEIAVEQSGGSNNPSGDRIGIDVIITRAVFSLMRSQPNIRTEMDKFPAGRMFLTTYATNSGAWLGILGDFTYTSPSNVAYGVFTPVSYTDQSTGVSQVYLCIHAVPPNPNGGPSEATPPPSDTGYWIPLQNEPTDPVLLDGWGNPIICAFGGALGSGTALNSNGSIPTGQGVLKAGGRSVIVTSPDKRLFWASAGPDGDFSKGDDNLYSFEKP